MNWFRQNFTGSKLNQKLATLLMDECLLYDYEGFIITFLCFKSEQEKSSSTPAIRLFSDFHKALMASSYRQAKTFSCMFWGEKNFSRQVGGKLQISHNFSKLCSGKLAFERKRKVELYRNLRMHCCCTRDIKMQFASFRFVSRARNVQRNYFNFGFFSPMHEAIESSRTLRSRVVILSSCQSCRLCVSSGASQRRRNKSHSALMNLISVVCAHECKLLVILLVRYIRRSTSTKTYLPRAHMKLESIMRQTKERKAPTKKTHSQFALSA